MTKTKRITIYILAIFMTLIVGVGFQTTPVAAAAKPKLSAVTSSSMKVKWTKKKSAVSYEVAYKIKGKTAWTYKTTKGTSLKIKGLKANKTYKVKVRAKGWVRNGKWMKCATKKTMTIKADMLRQVNKERKKRGRAPLKLYASINKTAVTKSKDLKKTKKFSHYSKNLGYVQNQFNKAGLRYFACGENIAYGYSDVTSVMKAWMKSKGHKANILEKSYTHLGVGKYKTFWTQHFAVNVWDPARQACPTCGKRQVKYIGACKDNSGKTLYAGKCSSCGQYILKCTECDQGIYLVQGIGSDGSFLVETTSCNKCGAGIDID